MCVDSHCRQTDTQTHTHSDVSTLFFLDPQTLLFHILINLNRTYIVTNAYN